MSDVVDTKRVGFTLIWRIENFSLLTRLSNAEVICTPLFLADNLEETLWNLGLRNLGFSSENKDTFYFRLSKSVDKVGTIILDYEITILSKLGIKTKSVTVGKFEFSSACSRGIPLLIKPHEILGIKEVLPSDTLTIQCKMWHHNKQCLVPGFASIRTRIGADRKSFIWTIDKFSALQVNEQKLVTVKLPSYSKLSFTIKLYLTGTPSYDEKIRMKVEGNNEDILDYIVMIGISVESVNNKTVYHFHEDFKLPKGKEEWTFPLNLQKKLLFSDKDILLPNDTLSLKCVLVVSKFRYKDFIVMNEIERSSYGADVAIDLEETVPDVAESPCMRNKEQPSSNSLANDMKHLFDDKYLSDLSLQVRGEEFSVHKAVLAARSSVFKTMLDTDMKERFTSTIKIDDFEPDTIRQLLLYIYSDFMENDIQWKNASSLCLAAEKYDVAGLKEKCSFFLKLHLSLTNVCEILLLADILNDKTLKNSAMGFVEKNDKDVMDSNVWKEFSKKHPQLTVEILSHLYRKIKF